MDLTLLPIMLKDKKVGFVSLKEPFYSKSKKGLNRSG